MDIDRNNLNRFVFEKTISEWVQNRIGKGWPKSLLFIFSIST